MYGDDSDFISFDEGYRREDWSTQAQKEAFYANALPCESCGEPVFGDRKRAWWDSELMVGPCCCADPLYDCIPVDANCPDLIKLLIACKSVSAVRLTFAQHTATCKECSKYAPEALSAYLEDVQRKGAGSAGESAIGERRAA